MLKHDSDYCIGCRACQVACQDLHHLTADRVLMEIIEEEKMIDGKLSVKYVMKPCRQCKDLACVKACSMGCLTVE